MSADRPRMGNITPDPKKRSYLLPPGCKDLIDLLNGAPTPSTLASSAVRVNGRIRGREVRVIDERGEQLGIVPLPVALRAARARGLDLVEIAPRAKPPVCRMVDYGKFRYESSRRRKRKS